MITGAYNEVTLKATKISNIVISGMHNKVKGRVRVDGSISRTKVDKLSLSGSGNDIRYFSIKQIEVTGIANVIRLS